MKRLVSVFTLCVNAFIQRLYNVLNFLQGCVDKRIFGGYTDNQKSSCELYFYSLRLFFCHII